MAGEIFLHEHDGFRGLIQIVSDELSILPELVEKDYWLMHCLWGLAADFRFELKGGTSLSKGFGIIDRFSEDIDIRISPPDGMEIKIGKNHDKASHIETRKKYFAWLLGAIKIPGFESVVRDTAYDDEKLRNVGIRLLYESRFPVLAGLKEGILLEVGFDDTAPNREVAISSWALDRAIGQKVPVRDNRATQVKCYCPEYTFVEKLQTISTKFRQQQKSATFPANFMRHYYDVYQLLAQPEVRNFIGTEAYEARKRQRFRKDDILKIAENEAFLLQDQKTRLLYRSEYQKTASLYYRGQIPFEDLLQRIKANIDRL